MKEFCLRARADAMGWGDAIASRYSVGSPIWNPGSGKIVKAVWSVTRTRIFANVRPCHSNSAFQTWRRHRPAGYII